MAVFVVPPALAKNKPVGGTVGSKGSCVIPVNLEQNVSLLHNFLFDDAAYQVSAQVQQYSNKVSSDTGR